MGFPLAIALTALALSPFAASRADAARSTFVSIAQGPRLDGPDLRGLVAAHVGMDRFLLSWRSVQRARGTFDWTATDKLVGNLAVRGIRPLPFVWGSPRWVRASPHRPPLGTASAEQAWSDFLKAAVARYRPGGGYWANGYRRQYGAGATPLPIEFWQIWNEPNMTDYFAPGETVGHAARQYARLLRISHDAIASRDPQAKIVLAGMLGNGTSPASDFVNGLYTVPGFKGDFDRAALHPYARDLDELRRAIERFRGVMMFHGDGATPLWLTEFGWGSAPPGPFGFNKGPSGQRQMLVDSFRLLLSHRTAWNLRRAFWFTWRDPAPSSPFADLCKWCGSAGLLHYNRTPKAAYYRFKRFAANTAPP